MPGWPPWWGSPDCPLSRRRGRRRNRRLDGTPGARAVRGRLPDRRATGVARGSSERGVGHFAGGITYVLLATLAGIGYGAAYQLTDRVEASICVHFAPNLAHLVLFTYPFAA